MGSKVVQEGQCQEMSDDSIHCEKIEKNMGWIHTDIRQGWFSEYH